MTSNTCSALPQLNRPGRDTELVFISSVFYLNSLDVGLDEQRRCRWHLRGRSSSFGGTCSDAETDALTLSHVPRYSLVRQTLTDTLKSRIGEADANGDGVLSVDELVGLVKSEQAAVANQRLFRRLLIFMSIMMLLAVAALVGCVWAIVDMQQQIKDDNDVLLSKDTLEPMSVGSAKQMSGNFSSLLGPGGLDMAVGLDRLILPNDDFSSTKIYTVQTVAIGEPESGATIYTTSGDRFEVSPSGELFEVDQAAAGGTRRLLVTGTVGGGPPAMVTGGTVTNTQLGGSEYGTYDRAECRALLKRAVKKYEKKLKKWTKNGEKGKKPTLVYPSDLPMSCRLSVFDRVGREDDGVGQQNLVQMDLSDIYSN